MEEINLEKHSPDWSLMFMVFYPSPIVMIGLATFTVMASAVRALFDDADALRKKESDWVSSIILESQHAAMMPIAASMMLLLLFYYFQAIQVLLLFFICGATCFALVFSVQPLSRNLLLMRCNLLSRQVVLWGVGLTYGDLLQYVFSVGLLIVWMVTGAQLLSDMLAISLCILFASSVRLPSLKVTAQLLLGLAVYDFFWVFLSKWFFSGKNVMVEAALQQADNPAQTVAERLHLPSDFISPHLDLPTKIFVPYDLVNGWFQSDAPAMLLGLGDIAFPGMLLTYLLSEDVALWKERHERQSEYNAPLSNLSQVLKTRKFWKNSYCFWCSFSYAFGVMLALGIGTVFHSAQPALIYIVPSILLTTISMAIRRGDIRRLWTGQNQRPDISSTTNHNADETNMHVPESV